MDEVKDKSGQQMDALSWKQEGVKNLPLQENGYFSSLFLASIVVLLFLLVQLMNSFKKSLHAIANLRTFSFLQPYSYLFLSLPNVLSPVSP